jgi:3-oxosteroid 1-dehydrogenase
VNDTGAAGWDHSVDVLIVGTGAGALTAAIRAADAGAEVLLIEKTEQFGGNSAMSGGVLWLPNSPLCNPAGGDDSLDKARDYLRAVVGEEALFDQIETYIRTIPEFIDYLHSRSHLRLDVLPQFPDMYPDEPGAQMHRCHEARPFNGKVLGEDLDRMRNQHPATTLFGLIGWTASESLALQARGEGWWKVAVSMVARYVFDIPQRLRSLRDRRQVLGGALVGSLWRSARDRKVQLLLNTGAEEILTSGGRVSGVRASRNGSAYRIEVRRAVILSSGGFEKSNEMRQKYLDGPTDAAWTAGSPGNTGEMIEEGVRLGAAVRHMDEAWWGPTITLPGEPQARMLVIEKNLPYSIMVNRAGERFVNESSSYTKVIRGMIAANEPGRESVPAYLVFDSVYRARYPFGPMLPGQFHPDWAVPKRVKEEIVKADSLRELAAGLGIDAEGLENTVARFNGFARDGEDPDFNRGGQNYDLYYGDHEIQPNPCLGPLEKPPFYGVRVYPGELGTKGGLLTNTRAQVLTEEGELISGLYAIGNCSAPVSGATYPASGATLGSAMVFGYIAGQAAAMETGEQQDPGQARTAATG